MRSSKKVRALFIVGAVVLQTGCAEKVSDKVDNKYNIAAKTLSEPVDKVMGANNKLAFKMLKQTYTDNKGKNSILSPISVSTLMALSQNSATGDTKKEMLKALELTGIDDKTINESYKSIIANFNSVQDINIKMANLLWINKGINLKEDFSNTGKQYYEAEINSVDFNKSKTVNTINQWVSDRTAGKIKKIVDKFDGGTLMALINTVYFKGDWFTPFDSIFTEKMGFNTGDGSIKMVDMMQSTGSVDYLKGQDFKAIRMPYTNQDFGMYIFLPEQGSSVDKLINDMSFDNWNMWAKNFTESRVEVKIPKFHVEFQQQLNDMMKSFGMKAAFGSSADFSKASDFKGFFISSILQKCYVDVDEKGTEAAAVTSEMKCGSAPIKDKPEEFIADRPFIFAIADKKTGYIMFTGVIESP